MTTTFSLDQTTPASSMAPQRHVLHKGDVLRLPFAHQTLHILSGYAWVTAGQGDWVIGTGETRFLVASPSLTLVSSLGESPVILDLAVNEIPHPSGWQKLGQRIRSWIDSLVSSQL
ncbi:MAG: hypothetical protein NW237_08315 [Cyanobacteriota bacterium]|nr:hypothetical protein [Cyanobacteriota bacterium]